jgi:hypothetical protein
MVLDSILRRIVFKGVLRRTCCLGRFHERIPRGLTPAPMRLAGHSRAGGFRRERQCGRGRFLSPACPCALRWTLSRAGEKRNLLFNLLISRRSTGMSWTRALSGCEEAYGSLGL